MDTSRTPLEQLKMDITKLESQVNKIVTQMKNPNTRDDVRKQMDDFIPVRMSTLNHANPLTHDPESSFSESICRN